MTVKLEYKTEISKMEESLALGRASISLKMISGTVVEGAKSPEAKEAHVYISLEVKPVVAKQWKFGQRLLITVTELPDE
jgi:hypothetical protein